jgi:arylsulfatase A-like enzyme
MREFKHHLLAGGTFALLLFAVERVLVARVHLSSQPSPDGVTGWLLATAALYLGIGLAFAALVGMLPHVRKRPWLVIHLAAATTRVAAVLGVPSWYATLATAGIAALLAHPLWWLARRSVGAGALAATLATAGVVALCVVHPRGLTPPPPTPAADAPPGAPDIVVVVLDTVRRDHVSAYGHTRATTPSFDAIAASGALLEQAWSASPWSLPSHVTLFTGLNPTAHGAHYEHPVFDRAAPTLAELLGEHGYLTVGVSGNPWLSRDNGSARGFARWSDNEPVRDLSRCFLYRWLWADNLIRSKGGEDSVAQARDALLADRERPLLLFVNVFEAHSPYDAVPADCGRAFLEPGTSGWAVRRMSDRLELAQTAGTSFVPQGEDKVLSDAIYDGAVHCADALLGEVMAAVDSSGRPTVVLALADHGENLGEHAMVGHHYGLYDLLTHVPAAIAYEGEIPAGSSLAAPVRMADMLPTLLDYAGVPEESWPATEGLSLRPWLSGTATSAPPEREVFAEHYVPVFILEAFRFARPAGAFSEIDRRRRTVVQRGRRYEVDSSGGETLFDLRADPGEQRDLLAAGAHPAAGELRGLLSAWIGTTAAPWGVGPDGPPETGLDAETEERLRALGYIH